ncbi:MAG TPA: tetratricopeptide repeat protein, partial [Vulgatibacter sp.]
AVDDDEPLEVGGDDEADDDLLLVPDGDLDDDETLEDWGAEPVVLTEADVTAGPSAEGIASPKDAEVTAVAEMGVTVVAKVDIAVMAEMGVTAGPVGEDDSIASSPSDVRTEEEIVDDPWADSALEFDGTGDPPGLGHGEVSEIETELAEGVFFLEQGYVAEAQETFRAVLAKAPDHPLANDLLAEAVRREAEGTGVTDIEAPPPTVLHRLTPGPKVKITPNLFSHGPDSAFDLAAELASEIHSVGPPAQTKEEFQFSVEDVLAEFKRGVSQTVSVEDTDTHYDLGIAYKEMGLLADAVSEFAIARQGCVGKKKEIDCLTMAGMCEALQGHHDRAISTYLEALESTAVIPEAAKALHFEIGVSYEATGDLASANQHFRKVAAMDPAYRDVALAVARTETAIPPPAGRAKEGRGKL